MKEKKIRIFKPLKIFFLVTILIIFLSLSFRVSPVDSQALYKDKPDVTEELFSRGKDLYQKQCSVCHGAQGMADGNAAYLLYPKPRNFAQDKFRLVSTTSMEVTDDDLFNVITRGMPGSAMPPWGHLSEEDRWALVYYVRYLSEIEKYKQKGGITGETDEKGIPWERIGKIVKKKIDEGNIIEVPPEPVVTQEALKRGRELFAASCAGCHGVQGKGDGQQKMADNLGYPLKPRDLTAGIFKGESSSKELYFRMIGGMPGSPMPSYTGVFTKEQIWELIHFVQTLTEPGAAQRVRLKHLSIGAKKISDEIDLNPFAPQWAEIKPTFVALTPLWWRDDRIEGVEIKALHNGDKVAFYLRWDDAAKDQNIVAVQSFSDGAALQLSAEQDPPFFGMGGRESPVHIWHWKSAWAHVGEERKDIENEYPNAAADYYESQKNYEHGRPFEASESKTQFHDPKFTAGWGAGNPISNPLKTETAEEGMAEGLGSYTIQLPEIEKVDARGIWKDGKWNVIFIRSLKSSDGKGLTFKPGDTVSVAFALWDGSHKDRNGQKMLSIWNDLILEK